MSGIGSDWLSLWPSPLVTRHKIVRDTHEDSEWVWTLRTLPRKGWEDNDGTTLGVVRPGDLVRGRPEGWRSQLDRLGKGCSQPETKNRVVVTLWVVRFPSGSKGGSQMSGCSSSGSVTYVIWCHHCPVHLHPHHWWYQTLTEGFWYTTLELGGTVVTTLHPVLLSTDLVLPPHWHNYDNNILTQEVFSCSNREKTKRKRERNGETVPCYIVLGIRKSKHAELEHVEYYDKTILLVFYIIEHLWLQT